MGHCLVHDRAIEKNEYWSMALVHDTYLQHGQTVQIQNTSPGGPIYNHML